VRVGLLTSWLTRRGGGVPEALAPLGRSLEAQGLEVSVFGFADPCGEGLRDGRGHAASVQTATPLPPRAFGYAPALGVLLERSRLDLMHVHGLWMYPSLASSRWSRRARRPYLVSPHGMLDPWALRNAAWKKRLAGRLFEDAHLAGAACLHALTEAEARAIRAYGLPNPIFVIPNGIDLPRDAASSRPGWLEASGKDRRIVLFLGRLHPKKGLEHLLAAWRAVQGAPGADDWLLVVAGWDQGGHEQHLRRLAEDHGIGRFVRFFGPQFDRDKAASFAGADAFVLPSLSEGLPVAVLEAWSYGLPVLMTGACNLPDGFEAGAALPIGTDPAGIAAGLRRLFAMSDTERRTMGACGQALVRRRFAWRQVGADMAAVYEWVLGGGPPPACVLTQ
jgi:glycosyltransferase involved in cell wall biosynthesis